MHATIGLDSDSLKEAIETLNSSSVPDMLVLESAVNANKEQEICCTTQPGVEVQKLGVYFFFQRVAPVRKERERLAHCTIDPLQNSLEHVQLER